jgi:hypothetical protein
MTAAGRDLFTPGDDALGLIGASGAALGDVSPDGATVHVGGNAVTVAPEMRPAIARLRTRRRLAGCSITNRCVDSSTTLLESRGDGDDGAEPQV